MQLKNLLASNEPLCFVDEMSIRVSSTALKTPSLSVESFCYADLIVESRSKATYLDDK